MKLSDYIADFLSKKGIRHVFVVTGGASAHLIDSVAKHPDIQHICPQHEQAGAMAADAYARTTGGLGAAMATSGPGATNLITGICCAYYDSVPAIYITGQVASFRLKGETGVRQLGFQETEIMEMCKPITKYAVLVTDPLRIRYELEKAFYLATTGRPGPVLIDVPDNIQREQVNPDVLEGFIPDKPHKIDINSNDIKTCLQLIREAKRPILIYGWGIALAKAREEALDLLHQLQIPVIPTWAVADMVPFSDPLLVGTFGLHGTRYANYAVQNADLILTIGTRLDTHETGSPLSSFAREAKKIVIDIDETELKKYPQFGMNIDLPIHADAADFIKALLNEKKPNFENSFLEWREKIKEWKQKYPICPKNYYQEKSVNPYVFVKELSSFLKEGDFIYVDTGCAIAWMMQAFEFKKNQKLFHAFNNTPMGYSLPASIGGSLALNKKEVICVTGDGSLQMNIQELATVIRHNLPIKLFLINNHGYSMIQQTQDQWFESRYIASDVEGGLAFPDFEKVAIAYGFKTVRIDKNTDLKSKINEVIQEKGPVFCNVEIEASQRVIPQVKFGRPIEDGDPLLDRTEFLSNMIVKPLEVSLKRI